MPKRELRIDALLSAVPTASGRLKLNKYRHETFSNNVEGLSKPDFVSKAVMPNGSFAEQKKAYAYSVVLTTTRFDFRVILWLVRLPDNPLYSNNVRLRSRLGKR